MANEAAEIRAKYPGLPVARRGRKFIEFDLGGGRKRIVLSVDPLHFGAAADQEIDTGWQADTGAWQWKLTQGDYQAHARSVFNAGSLVEWRIGNEWVIFDPQSINWINQDSSRQQIAVKQAVNSQANDYLLSFQNAYGAGRHFEYVAHPNRLIKHIILDSLASLPAPTVTGTVWFEAEFSIATSSGVDFYLDGVRWAKTNGVRVQTASRIEFRDAATGTQVLWLADAPVATDANGDTAQAQYEVRRQGGQSSLFITVRVPREWLLTAAYPVKIDPTLAVQPDATAGKDTKLNSSQTTRNYGITGALLGSTTDKMLVEFDASPIPADATCDADTLSLYQSGSAAALAFTLTAYSIASGNAAWIEGTRNNAVAGTGEPCWDYLAYNTTGWAGSAGMGTSGTDYEATALGAVSGNRSDANGTEYAFSLTLSRIEGWFGASNTNYGVLVITSAGCGNIASSDNATAGWRPKMVIDYTEASGGAMIGSAAGSSSASGTLSGAGALSGSAAGTGAAAAALTGAGALSGSIAGISTATGELSGAGSVAGSAAGSSASTGILTGAGALVGASAGLSTCSGNLIGQGALAGTAAGAATASGTLTNAGSTGDLIGSAAGTSSASGVLTGLGNLAGTAAGSSSAIAYVGGTTLIAGTAAGTSSASGVLTGQGALVGSAAGSSSAQASVGGVVYISGAAAGGSSANATLAGVGYVFGSAAGSSYASGTVTATGMLQGAAAGVAIANATLAGVGILAGSSAGVGQAIGYLAAWVPVVPIIELKVLRRSSTIGVTGRGVVVVVPGGDSITVPGRESIRVPGRNNTFEVDR